MSQGQRRTAAEWQQVLRELERSGETAVAFARARGIRPDTLKWWRWRLRSKGKRAASPGRSVKLIAVDPMPESARESADRGETPVWELVAPSGHELRVYDERGLSVLHAALMAIAGNRRR